MNGGGAGRTRSGDTGNGTEADDTPFLEVARARPGEVETTNRELIGLSETAVHLSVMVPSVQPEELDGNVEFVCSRHWYGKVSGNGTKLRWATKMASDTARHAIVWKKFPSQCANFVKR